MPKSSKRIHPSGTKKEAFPYVFPPEILRQFLGKSNVIFWAVDQKGIMLILEGDELKTLGFNPKDWIGESIFKGIGRNPLVQKAVRRALKGETLSTVLPWKKSFFETKYIPWKDARGRMLGAFGFSMDVTEAFAAKQELWRREKREEILAQTSQDLIVFFSQKGERIYESPGIEKILGFKPGERESAGPVTHLHPEDQKRADAAFKRALKNPGVPVRVETRVRHKHGHWIYGDVIITNFLDKPGVEAVVVQTRDISEKKAAEEALRLSEQRFRGMVENSQDIITLLDAEGRRLYEAPSIQKVLGFEPGERGGTTFDNHPPEDVPKARRAFREALKNPGKAIQAQLKVRRKDGTFIDAEMSITNLLKDPSVRGVVVNGRDVTKRKKAEENLKNQERHYRALIDNAHDVIYILDRTGKRIYESPSVERVLGFKPGERTGSSVFESMHPDDLEKARQTFKKILKTPGWAETIELRTRHKKGHWVYAEVNIVNLLEDPSVNGVIVNFRDITQRKNTEMALRQSEESFRALIEKSPDGILVHRKDFISYANPAFLAMAGYEKLDEVIGLPWNFHLPPEEIEKVQKRIERLTDPGAYNPPVERNVKCKDGTLLPVESLSFSVVLENEKFLVAVIRDLSQKKEAQLALEKAEKSFRNLIELSPDAIMIHTQEKNLYTNKAFLKLFGYESPEELPEKPWQVMVAPEEIQSVLSRIKRVGVSNAPNPPMERRILKKNHERVPVEVVSFTVLFEGQTAMAAVFRDLTERKNAEKILLKYTRLGVIGEMAAGLAHEIRNPLSGIGLSAQYLSRKYSQTPEAQVQVQNILDQTERLKQLVNDTLDFSRDTPLQDLTRVDAWELMQTSLRLVQVQFGPKNTRVEVKWTFEKGRFFVWVSPNRIQQVLVNLILNAYQAMERGGILSLGCSNLGNGVVFRVEDNGPGITPEARIRLFEPFFTSKKNGSGLGLSVSQRIVEAHGGHLRVENPAQGAAFLVELPGYSEQNALPPEGRHP